MREAVPRVVLDLAPSQLDSLTGSYQISQAIA